VHVNETWRKHKLVSGDCHLVLLRVSPPLNLFPLEFHGIELDQDLRLTRCALLLEPFIIPGVVNQ